MIRITLFIAVFLSLSVTPAGAAIWLFGGKKKDETAIQPTEPPKTFLNSYENDPAQKKWVLDQWLNKPKTQTLSPVFDKKIFDTLTPEMLTAAYVPKSAKELGMIAVAHNIWEGGALAQMEADAQARVAAAKKKSDAALMMLSQKKARQMAAEQSGMPLEQAPVETPASQPSKPVIFNKPKLDEPPKVFRDYR